MLSRRNPSHPHRLRRILAPSSAVLAPHAGAGDEGFSPNPLVPTRLSTHGRFCSFLAGLRACRRVSSRLCVALASRHRQRLRPSDSQRGQQSVFFLLEYLARPPLAESPILFTRNAKKEAELCHHVEEMVSKEALELAPLPSPGF